MSNKPSVCVMGLGYIGLPTAALLANRNFSVKGVDVVEEVVTTINSGKVHIVEPDLDAFVHAGVNSGYLKAYNEAQEADVFIIAVPTPFHEGYVPNIDYVLQATQSISKVLMPGNLIILESTSPVGTTEAIVEKLKKESIDTSTIYVAHCPERVLPGQVMRELIENDRIVGGINKESTKRAADFYRQFVKGAVIETEAKMAEMCKLTENSFRDVNIAFANELSMICDELDLNVWELVELANRHPRVNILQPGPGVGGHCIAVDPWFIVNKSPEHAKIIRLAREINDFKPQYVIKKVKEEARKLNKNNLTIACLGLSYKPDIDDLRESPALQITKDLSNDFTVFASEPNLMGEVSAINKKLTEGIAIEDTLSVIQKADIILLLVNHKEYYQLPVESFKNKVLIDTKGVIKS